MMRDTSQQSHSSSESGQSIVILALGFVVLLAFVGLTTDISLMFVRYSTLSRAVDSASIAAANQMREGNSLATVSLAARQFIEFHGLNPTLVLVDTCLSSGGQGLPQADMTPEQRELCTEDQRKLVRVTAEVESPTVFLRLLGWQNFPLQASALSETAVLDVVIIMDVSESMLSETTYSEWADVGLGMVYVPPLANDIATAKGISSNALWSDMLNVAQGVVNQRLTFEDAAGPGDDPAYTVSSIDYFGGQSHPREQCRVRFYPFSVWTGLQSYQGRVDPSTDALVPLKTFYTELGAGWPATQNTFDGFVPTYNFYGCCNDPNGDGSFEDLVCEPFNGARNATEQFLERIDFVRGDRAAFVTFDRNAFLVNPYGEFDDGSGSTVRPGAMIDNLEDARQTLINLIGVRAEPNFYTYDAGSFVPGVDNARTFRWTGLAAGLDGNTPIPFDPDDVSAYNPTDASDTRVFNYPVKDNCPFQNGALFDTHSLFPLALHRMTLPNRSIDSRWATYTTPVDGNDLYLDTSLPIVNTGMSYDLWSSCRGTNIGAAIREGSNALLDPTTVRRFGSVWVMVLLSDGAAGASDPVRRNGDKLLPGNPYAQASPGDDFGVQGEYGAYGLCPYGLPDVPGELVSTDGETYPAQFPYCSDESPLTRHSCDFRPMRGSDFMRDNDYDPNLTLEQNIELGNVYDVDIANCDMLYDVDDYARDWSDIISLERDDEQDLQLPTMFTIGFGLNFRVGSVGGAPGPVDDIDNAGDYLGEQLLRYIADAGDNNRIDNDFYQDWLDEGDPMNRQINGVLSVGEQFGVPGPCQDPSIQRGAGDEDYDLNNNGIIEDTEMAMMYSPLPPTQSCGNYFNAPTAAELEFVFDEIASRMFTRLAR